MKSGLLKNRIGIQIITRDRHSYLAVLLSSLLNQTQKNWDLFLVDNSTTPVNKDHLCNTLINRINNEGHRVLYNIVDPSIRDIGQLRNIALDMDDCEIGCRIDDDSYCEPDYLKRLYDVMEIFNPDIKMEEINKLDYGDYLACFLGLQERSQPASMRVTLDENFIRGIVEKAAITQMNQEKKKA